MAFRAGELAGARRARRRSVPALVLLGALAAAGWGVAWARPAPAAVPPVEVVPDYEAPPAWRNGYDILAGVDPDTLADPPVVTASAPPPPFPEDDR